jgi:hypothetical protein
MTDPTTPPGGQAGQPADDIRMCIDRRVPKEQASTAEADALAERPDNLRVVPIRRGGPVRARMALIVETEWKPGTTLAVRFLDGDPAARRKVEDLAHTWEDHANVTFVFDDRADAPIRISFELEGSWSYLGRDALQIPAAEPTMNFGWLRPDSADDEYSRVVLHEFGHALGCVHEHQSPAVSIPWDREAVYAYYARQGWSRSETDDQVLIPYSPAGLQFSRFDPDSIMLYAVDNRLTEGDFEVGWNRALSSEDKAFIGTRYPFDEHPIVELAIGGAPGAGTLTAPGQADWFRFRVADAGRYAVATAGRTDVVMSLHGPENQSALLAFDDDSGPGLNARIVHDLAPATYYVQVRHWGPTGTGQYEVAVEPV